MIKMGFKWKCPSCNLVYNYNGSKNIDAITTCTLCDKKYRIYQYKVIDSDYTLEAEDVHEYPINNKLYFIKSGKFVKIGYTKSIERRLENLQSSNPNKLKLIFLVDDSKDLETKLHNFFKKYNKHHRGEWFVYDEFTERVLKVLKIYKKQMDKKDKIKNRIIKGLEYV